MSIKDEVRHILALPAPTEKDLMQLVRISKIAGARSFARQVKDMRSAQKAYFGTRQYSDLEKSKQLEQTVDASVESIIEGIK